MKMKYLLLVSFILAIITIGAVSAVDEGDALAVDETGDEMSQIEEVDVVTEDLGETDSGDDTIGAPEQSLSYYLETPSEKIRADEDISSIGALVYSSDATGNITVKIDDGEGEKIVYNEKIVPYSLDYETYIATGGNKILIKDLNLKPGTYDYVIGFDGDETYKPFNFTGSFNLYFIDVHADEVITENNGMYIEWVNDATGIVEVFIDDKSYVNLTTYGIGAVDLFELPYGPHTYKVLYRDDEKYVLDKPIEGEFNYSYRFDVYLLDGSDIYIDADLSFKIVVPEVAGEIIIKYNGKTITEKVPQSYYYEESMWVSLTDFGFGENNITFTYKNDNYPERSIIKTIEVLPRLYVPYEIRYNNEDDAISILLPGDATGNLVIYEGAWNETSGEYEYEKLANVSLTNGKANYTLKNFKLGKHYIKAIYDGDDYSKYLYEQSKNIDIIPDVQYENSMWVKATNTIKVILPDDVDDNLTVRIIALNEGNDYDKIIFNQAANGTVTIQLPELEIGDYKIYAEYDGQVNYGSQFKVGENSPEFELNVTFPSVIDSETVIRTWIPHDANGKLVLYINGEKQDYSTFFNIEFDYETGKAEYYIHSNNYGNHTWEIRFVDDSYYKDTSKSGQYFMQWVHVPEFIWDSEYIEISLDEKEGYIEFKVDGKHYDTQFLDSDSDATIFVKDLSYGIHDYEINYYDKNNVKQLTQSGSFNFTYLFYTNLYRFDNIPLTDEFELEIMAPLDATGIITVTVNDKEYAFDLKDTRSVIITNLVLGENNFTTKYSGDSNYPADEIKQVLNVIGYGITVKYDVDEYEEYDEEDEFPFVYVSILLPNNANGNLTLYEGNYIEGYEDECLWYDGHWEIDWEKQVLTVKLINGSAKINASDLRYGVYDIFAAYVSEDDDYSVEPKEIHFDLVPEVNVTDKIIEGNNATFTVIIPGATNNLTIYQIIGFDEDDNPICKEYQVAPENGKFVKEISDLKLGTYDFYLSYDDGTGDIFNHHTTYTVEVMPLNATIPDIFNADGSGVITLILPEGSSGKVSVYEKFDYDGGDMEIEPIIRDVVYTSANKTIEISGLSSGEHMISVVYEYGFGEVYAFSNEVYVPKPDASSNINIPSTISGDSLDITLPNDATGGILVTIDGETSYIPLVNGSAKVDISKLADGAHTIGIKYPGDGNYSRFEKTANVNVKNSVDPKINAADLSVIYSAGTKYSVTIYGTDGKLAANTQVTILINNKLFKTVNTDAKGVATVQITQKPGSYKITTKALGISVTKKLTVKHVLKLQKVKVKRSAKKLVIKATLVKVNGKYLKGKKITLKFKGKKYTAKTNKKGVAKFTIKKSVLKKLKKGKKVTYQATYLKDTIKYTIKVK